MVGEPFKLAMLNLSAMRHFKIKWIFMKNLSIILVSIFSVVGITIFATIVTLFLNSFVMISLWGWFLIPLGFPTITYPMAIGISLIISLLFQQYIPPKDNDMMPLLNALLKPLYILFIGNIVSNYI